MREFVFCSTAKDKFGQAIHLGDIIIYGGGTQSQSNVAFAFVTRISEEGGSRHLIGYNPISENLKSFRSQGNNKRKWSNNIVKVPKEWNERFVDVCIKFNEQEFGCKFPTQEEIDKHFKEKEYDDYQRWNKLGKYAPKPIDKELWKSRVEEFFSIKKELWKRLILAECEEKDLKALWESDDFSNLGKRLVTAIRVAYPGCDKIFKDNGEEINSYLFNLFKEIVYDWTIE